VALIAIAACWHVTFGFRALTAESVRRLQIASEGRTLAPLGLLRPDGETFVPWGGAIDERRVYLLDFIYTRCETVCSVLGAEFAQLQAELELDDRVRLLSISFDATHDTPEALERYARRHGASPAWWSLGVPNDAAAHGRLLREAGVVVIDDARGGYAHNAAILVVRGDGALVRVFDYPEHREALAFARSLGR
jgi:protein SCO1/2